MNPVFKISKVCGKMIFGIFILIFCEALSFRFIENYADFKVKLNWGDINSKTLDAGRISIPFGALSSSPPTSIITSENTFQRIIEEDDYSKSILKFGRPARDKYFDYITEVQSPLANFDIRNFQDGMNLYVPSLNRFANKNDIECGYARRIGDKIEYSKAVFIEVLNKDVSEDSDFARQKSFGFLLGKGISCLTLKVQSQKELNQRIENLREQAPLQSQNIILWGEDQSASYMVEYLLKNQDVVSLAIIKDPAKLSDAIDSSIKPWILSIVSNPYLEEVPNSTINSILQVVDSARASPSSYTSKIGGLLTIFNHRDVGYLPSIAVPVLLKSVLFTEDRIQLEKHLNPEELAYGEIPSPNLEKSMDVTELDLQPKKYIGTTNLNDIEFDYSFEEKELVNDSLDFDCEILRAYKEIHANDPDLPFLSDRQIILRLGNTFEEMGQSTLESIKIKDSRFFEIYQSIK